MCIRPPGVFANQCYSITTDANARPRDCFVRLGSSQTNIIRLQPMPTRDPGIVLSAWGLRKLMLFDYSDANARPRDCFVRLGSSQTNVIRLQRCQRETPG